MPENPSPPPPSESSPSWTRWLRPVLLGAAVVLLSMAWLDNHAPVPKGAAPPVSLRSYDGQNWDLDRFSGKPIVLNFWATWCPPCLQELPHFARAAERHRDDVVFVGAAVNSPPAEVFAVIDRFQLRYPIAAASSQMQADWRANSVPATYFLNARHEVVWSAAGALTAAELETALAEHFQLAP